MSIKIKIIAIFSLLLLLVGIIVFYSRTNISNSAELISETYDKPLMASNFTRDSLIGFLRLQKNLAQNGYDKEKFDKLYDDITSSLDVVGERLVSEKSRPMLEKARALLKQWADVAVTGDMASAKDIAKQYDDEADLLIENEFSAAHDYVINTRAEVDHYNAVLLIMNGLCLFISLAGGIFLFVSIYRPIRTSIAISQNIAGGHFDNDIQIRGSTEFRYLLAALKEMQAKLIFYIEERQKVLNCLGQGFLMFDRDGVCTPVYSRSCQTLLETTPPGKHIADILHIEGAKRDKFNRILKLVFDKGNIESLELLTNFAPNSYAHSQGLHVRVDYKADPSVTDGTLSNVIVIATDITKQVQAQAEAVEQKNALESLERVLRNRQAFGGYMRSAAGFIEKMSGASPDIDKVEMRREAHTLKGGAGAFRLTALMDAFHSLESALPKADTPLDWPALKGHVTTLQEKLDAVRVQFDELLGVDVTKLDTAQPISKEQLFTFASYLTEKGLADARREFVRRLCTESFIGCLKHYDVLLEDLADQLGKKVAPIRFRDADIQILASRYEKWMESFVHIFRNIMDHGIEPLQQRRVRGKDEAGRIDISFRITEAGGKQWLQMEIQDDGNGVDIAAVREKLRATHPEKDWIACDDRAVLDHMLVANLSTKGTVSQLSGRGIGLNAVYHETQKLGGTLKLESVPGQGTRFVMQVPYILDVS